MESKGGNDSVAGSEEVLSVVEEDEDVCIECLYNYIYMWTYLYSSILSSIFCC